MRLLLFCLVFIALAAAAEDVFVSNSGDDRNPGTKDRPVKTLTRAVGLAREHDRIQILQGRYGGPANNPLVEVSLNFFSYDGNGKAMIHGSGSDSEDTCFTLYYPEMQVGFHGLVIRDCKVGVRVSTASNVFFGNTTLENHKQALYGAKDPIIVGPTTFHFLDSVLSQCNTGYKKEHNTRDYLFARNLTLLKSNLYDLHWDNVEYSLFHQAGAGATGGRVYQSTFDAAQLDLDLATPFTIERSTFTDNVGSAVQAKGGLLYVYETVFKRINGSALHLKGTFADIVGTTFDTCGLPVPGVEGGAISLTKGGALNARNAHFRHNSAFHGGAVYCEDSLATISNSDFEHNSASKVGGAVDCLNCLTNGEGNHYRDNKAPTPTSCPLPTSYFIFDE